MDSLPILDTLPGPPPVGGSHEPLGYVRLTARDFTAKVENGWTDRGDAAFSIVQDPTAPQSPASVGQALFTAGPKDGTGPIKTGFTTTTKPRGLFIDLWIKVSPNWVGHSSNVNKVLHLWINGGNRAYLNLAGNGSGTLAPRVELQGVNEVPVSRNLYPTANAPNATRGVWHRWEILLIANTPGKPDGVARWWVDGKLKGDYSNINYVPVAPSRGAYWSLIDWNPTWGGRYGTIPAPQWMQIDRLTVSGAP
jgi:hypothetical protein